MDAAYSDEWRALEALCRAFPGLDVDPVAALVERRDFGWGTLLEEAVRHKLHPLLAWYFATTDLARFVPKGFGTLLRDVWTVNARRLDVYAVEAAAIVGEARRRGIPLVTRKGLAFEATLYGDQGLRAFDDLDFMTPPDSGQAVTAMMRDLGFEAGKVDRLRRRIVPHDRRKLVTYRLAPDHLPPFSRSLGDPFVGHLEVDVAMSFTWWGSEYEVPLAEAFAGAVTVKGARVAVPAFSPEYQFVDAALHLFREAFVEMPFQDQGNAVKLRTFLDVRLLLERLRAEHRLDALREAVPALGIARPVAWVLAHLDGVFGGEMLRRLGLQDAASPEWVAGWRRMGGEPGRWHGDMRRRLAAGGAIETAESRARPADSGPAAGPGPSLPGITADRFGRGMTFEDYVSRMVTNREKFLDHYRSVVIRPADSEALRRREGKCRILVLTEDWCADALDTLPVLGRLIEGLPNFELRIFLRDQNPDLMERYLNRGIYRSIPVFVFFDESMNEIARLVERPGIATVALERRVLQLRHDLRDLVEQRIREARGALRQERREEWWQAFVEDVTQRLRPSAGRR